MRAASARAGVLGVSSCVCVCVYYLLWCCVGLDFTGFEARCNGKCSQVVYQVSVFAALINCRHPQRVCDTCKALNQRDGNKRRHFLFEGANSYILLLTHESTCIRCTSYVWASRVRVDSFSARLQEGQPPATIMFLCVSRQPPAKNTSDIAG